MQTNTDYIKVSSYEAKGDLKRVLLLYSGGLDTSTMLKWIQDQYKAEVIALTLDIGQQSDDLEEIKAKAIKLGAKEAIVYDAKDRFADEVIAKGIKANARYQGQYHLSTPMGRVITTQIGVEMAKKYNCDAIAHGSTGKGNDQVRFDAYSIALDPDIKVIAPVREWGMERPEQIEWAKKHGVPVPAAKDFPFSVDDNMFGMTWQGDEIEDPSLIAPLEKFLTTYTLPEKAPDKPQVIKLTFEEGLPVAIDDKKYKLSDLIKTLNHIGGAHGIGVMQQLEDRIIGLKDGNVYEMPGAAIIINAHENLERYVTTRITNEIKSQLDIKWGYLCYSAMWFDQSMQAINAFNEEVNKRVSGDVYVKLYKGSLTIIKMDSDWGLGHVTYTTSRGYDFNVNASAGFIEIHSLQMKIANEVANKNLTHINAKEMLAQKRQKVVIMTSKKKSEKDV